jgi:alkylhydroperoxidase family enzyme
MIERGETRLATLDHRSIDIVEQGPRWFLTLLDGSRDRAELAAQWQATEHAERLDVDTALRQLARAGLLSA